MEIQSLPVNAPQAVVREEAAVKVQAMLMQTIKDAGADVARLMDSARFITDPARGNYLNMLM
jgi:hypothetical protein